MCKPFFAKHRETNDRHRDEQLKRYVAQTLRGMPGWATTRAKIWSIRIWGVKFVTGWCPPVTWTLVCTPHEYHSYLVRYVGVRFIKKPPIQRIRWCQWRPQCNALILTWMRARMTQGLWETTAAEGNQMNQIWLNCSCMSSVISTYFCHKPELIQPQTSTNCELDWASCMISVW